MRIVVFSVFFLFSTLGSFAQKPSNQSKPSAPVSLGSVVDNVYRNPQLGFTYKILMGWVDRTDQNKGEPGSSSSGQVLLSIFEHPPEVKGEGVNSAAIIAAESLSAYPGVKTAADYFEPLTEATTSQGFKVLNEPYATTVGAKPLVRSDYSKETGKITMYQSSLVMLSKGYAVSFTFIGGSEDEVEQMIGKLSFGVALGSKK
jgi:hypothetical protein